MSKEKVVKKVMLKNVILSYPALAEPEAFGDQAEKFKATFVITDENQVKEVQAAALEVGKAYFGADVAKKIRSGKIKFAVKKSGEEDSYPEGSYYIRTTSKNQPGLVSIYPSKDDPKKPARIEGKREIEEAFYPGAIVNASLVVTTYDRPDSKGITFFLNNVQKVRDGERLDSRVRAEDEFDVDADAVVGLEDFEAAEDEPASDEDDLGDLIG